MTDERIAEIAAGLTEVQVDHIKLDEFLIDGWCSPRGQEAARASVSQGLFTTSLIEEEQYTAIIYTITNLGLAVRNHLQERGDG